MMGFDYEFRQIKQAHSKRVAAVATAREQLNALRAETDYSASFKKRKAAEIIGAAKLQVDLADATVNERVQAVRGMVQRTRTPAVPDPTAELLRETKLSRVMETARRRWDAGGLRAADIERQISEAKAAGDLVTIQALQDVLPEFIAASGRQNTAEGRILNAEFRQVAVKVSQASAEMKSPDEREADQAEALLKQAAAVIDRERRSSTVDLGSLVASEAYFAGESDRQVLVVNVASELAKRGERLTFTPALGGPEVLAADPQQGGWDFVYSRNTPGAGAGIKTLDDAFNPETLKAKPVEPWASTPTIPANELGAAA